MIQTNFTIVIIVIVVIDITHITTKHADGMKKFFRLSLQPSDYCDFATSIGCFHFLFLFIESLHKDIFVCVCDFFLILYVVKVVVIFDNNYPFCFGFVVVCNEMHLRSI